MLATALIIAIAINLWSQPPSRVEATNLCPSTGSSAGPFNTVTYEATNRTVYNRVFELAGLNQLFPGIASFNVPSLSGPQASTHIPPALLKAIAWIESGMVQADWTVPWGGVGPALISHDCGYGIMQVTSGMQNTTGIPSLDQAMIAGNFAFNIARGAWILADKWNWTWLPPAGPVVGDGNTKNIENWYYAVWLYNGFAEKNHPMNPWLNQNNPWPRLPYSCGPLNDGYGHDRSLYPYQELVFGCLARPPVVSGQPLWTGIDVKLPDLWNPANAGLADINNFYKCSPNYLPHDYSGCPKMNIPTPQPAHQDGTLPQQTREQLIGQPAFNVSPADVSIEVASGGSSSSASFVVANSGTGLLTWRATTSAPWLSVSQVQGVALSPGWGNYPAGFTTTVKVMINAASLSPGPYQGSITLESLYPSNSKVTVKVNLTVTPGPSPTPTPSPSPTPSPTPEPTLMTAGDVNCDTQVTVIDALGVLQFISGLSTGDCLQYAGNVDCQGGINIQDALLILQHLVGLPLSLPGDCPPPGTPFYVYT
ncbi:MAG TPA: hypothetical protein VNL15_03290 [Dehalococcoidia bacterium]|nr:hypothetical protein [Dehalococcoidia bacterium]